MDHNLLDGKSRVGTHSRHKRSIPVDTSFFDATVSLLREGYRFIPNHCERLQTDIFRTRLMLRTVICTRGPEAARLFYGSDHLTRVGSMPQTVLRLLQDKNSVQQLDGDAHRHRKAMFVRMMMTDAGGSERLLQLFRECWKEQSLGWEGRQSVRLDLEVARILAKTAFRWTGVPAGWLDVETDGRLLAEMIEGAGHFGPRTWLALFRRSRLERRLAETFVGIRNGSIEVAEHAPMNMLAAHRDLNGNLLPPETAAVELINLLRPIVAIGRYIVFTATALNEHDEWCRLFTAGNEELLSDFVEEVRRISPFFPFVGAIAKSEFDFQGHRISKGQWLLFDLYGTTHDGVLFPEPDRFKPYRQLSWRNQDFSFVPQGAGDTATTHRCPGEQVTVGIIREAVKLLCRTMTYDVAIQNSTTPLDRIPTGPVSGFEISNVRLRR